MAASARTYPVLNDSGVLLADDEMVLATVKTFTLLRGAVIKKLRMSWLELRRVVNEGRCSFAFDDGKNRC